MINLFSTEKMKFCVLFQVTIQDLMLGEGAPENNNLQDFFWHKNGCNITFITF